MIKCKHENTRNILTAKSLEIVCDDCKEPLHSRTRVLSSNIFAVARVGKHVEIQFLSKEKGPGPVYISTSSVPQHVFEELMAAASVGSYFQTEMREVYDFEKVEVKK